ncbi:LpxI family protein [Flavimaricola marinus]|uniref:Phosphatidate cytidylyltransferase n=1 Tax=Flavimaricola marinus TaxID=1819565 RepID=A0A238LCY9_9RHOB|nr:UDP-2,3-diacylglucosamine diphosphatase LpxI [Flavimaricola marinus]SMY07481.1 hypothetical protein LOM8899_01617 [Flavimaricola marinus]
MIALIAGTGALPAVLIARLRARGDTPVVCALHGFVPEVPDGVPTIGFRLETLGSLLQTLKDMGVTRICMAGAIRRPVIDPALIDDATRPLVPILMDALGKGDDGALRAMIGVFEDRGIEVVSAHGIAPELLARAGIPTLCKPEAGHVQDAAVAEDVIAQMGKADQGQACIVGAGRVLAKEDQAGTDAMLDTLATTADPLATDPLSWMMSSASDIIGGAADWLSNSKQAAPGSGAILFKAPKPDQDRRADLPVIGPDTARRICEVGLDGIVIEAGAVMVLDQDTVVATLDQAGKFLWIRPHGGAA